LKQDRRSGGVPPPWAAPPREPVSNPAGQPTAVANRKSEVASRESESDVPAGVPGKTEGEPSVRHDAPSHDASSPAAEERNSVPAAGDKRDGKTPEPAGANTGGVKLPEIKMSARVPVPVAPKRHIPGRRPIEQAALENRSSPQENRSAPAPAPDNAPSRVFGVGF
jgi:hypothetical protein